MNVQANLGQSLVYSKCNKCQLVSANIKISDSTIVKLSVKKLPEDS